MKKTALIFLVLALSLFVFGGYGEGGGGGGIGVGIDLTSPFNNTLITKASGTGTIVYDVSNPSTGQISIYGGTVTKVGKLLCYQFRVISDQDDEYILELDSSLVPGEIVSASIVADDGSLHQLGFRTPTFPNDREFRFNRDDAIDSDLDMHLLVWVDGGTEPQYAAIEIGRYNTKLQRVDNDEWESAQAGVEYYSNDQCGGIYGTVYRQYFTTSLPGGLTSGNNILKLVDYSISFNDGGNRGVARGYTSYSTTADVQIMLSGTSGYGNLSLSGVTWTVIGGWVEYTK